jgi:phage regulator Rha-like protein
MKELNQNTITTLDVAEMMEITHSKILRKLEGDSKQKGIINTLSEAEIGVADYFIESTYTDAQGKQRKCYEVTKLGCDFLANKSTGEKGNLFTARYVKKFYELEHQCIEKQYDTKATSLGEVASYTKEMGRRMEKQNSEQYKIAEAFKMVSEQFGIRLPDDFVKVPEYRQVTFLESYKKG